MHTGSGLPNLRGRFPVILTLARWLTAISLALAAAPALAAQVWLGGVDPFVRHVLAPESPSDYMDLFQAVCILGAGLGEPGKGFQNLDAVSQPRHRRAVTADV